MGKSWRQDAGNRKWRNYKQQKHRKKEKSWNTKNHRPYVPPADWDAMGDDVTKFSYPEREPRWDDMAS